MNNWNAIILFFVMNNFCDIQFSLWKMDTILHLYVVFLEFILTCLFICVCNAIVLYKICVKGQDTNFLK